MVKVKYEMETQDLCSAFRVALEMENEMGITPVSIEIDGKQCAYKTSDAKAVIEKNMDELAYITGNELSLTCK